MTAAAQAVAPESGAETPKCSAIGEILTPCVFLRSAMTGPYRKGAGGRGLFLMTLIEVRTGKPTRSCVVHRGGLGNDKREICLSYCPFCGADIHSHFIKRTNA